MKREDILRVARECGATDAEGLDTAIGDIRLMFKLWPEELERFAERVRAATKEEDAGICEQLDEDGDNPDSWGWHSKDYAKAIRASK